MKTKSEHWQKVGICSLQSNTKSIADWAAGLGSFFFQAVVRIETSYANSAITRIGSAVTR